MSLKTRPGQCFDANIHQHAGDGDAGKTQLNCAVNDMKRNEGINNAADAGNQPDEAGKSKTEAAGQFMPPD